MNRFVKISLINKLLPYIFIVGYALLFLIFNYSWHIMGNYGSESDFFYRYAPAAKKLVSGGMSFSELLADYGGFYVFLIAFFKTFFAGDLFVCGYTISIISSAIALLFLFKILQEKFNYSTAWLVMLAYASLPIFQRHSFEVGLDMLSLALAFMSIYFLTSQKSNNYLLIFGGLLGGFSFLTRVNMAIFLPFIILLGFKRFHWKGYNWKRILPALLAFLIIFAGWVLNNFIRNETFLNSESNYVVVNSIYLQKQKTSSMPDSVSEYLKDGYSALDLILFAPFRFVENRFKALWHFLFNDITKTTGVILLPLMLVGLYLRPPYLWTRQQIIISLFGILSLLILAFIHWRARYSLPHLFLYYLIAFYPITHPLRNTRVKLFKTVTILLILILFASFLFQIPKSAIEIKKLPYELLATVRFMKKYLPNLKNIRVASRKPHIKYYAGVSWKMLPPGLKTPENVAKWAIRNHVSLLYWSYEEDKSYPTLSFFNKIKPHGTWKPIYNNQFAALYKLDLLTNKMLK